MFEFYFKKEKYPNRSSSNENKFNPPVRFLKLHTILTSRLISTQGLAYSAVLLRASRATNIVFLRTNERARTRFTLTPVVDSSKQRRERGGCGIRSFLSWNGRVTTTEQTGLVREITDVHSDSQTISSFEIHFRR